MEPPSPHLGKVLRPLWIGIVGVFCSFLAHP